MGRKKTVFPLIDGIPHRTCKVCNQFLPLEENFYSCVDKRNNRVYQIRCTKCHNKIKTKKYKKQYALRSKRRRELKRDELRQKERAYHQSEQGRATRRKYVLNNRERMCEKRRIYENARRKTNPNARISKGLRGYLNKHLKKQKASKQESAIRLIGCSIEDFRKHLESLWKLGMSWENYGTWEIDKPKWHIDHIRPCASFDLTDPEQQKQCFHWSNMQPLWASENMSKNDKLNWTPST